MENPLAKSDWSHSTGFPYRAGREQYCRLYTIYVILKEKQAIAALAQ